MALECARLHYQANDYLMRTQSAAARPAIQRASASAYEAAGTKDGTSALVQLGADAARLTAVLLASYITHLRIMRQTGVTLEVPGSWAASGPRCNGPQ